MTREEAIVHIKDIICESNSTKPNIVVFEQEKEALYMAIKALEQPKTEPCEDTISRQEVLDEISKSVDHSLYAYKSLMKCVKSLPPAKPQEPKTDKALPWESGKIIVPLPEPKTDVLDKIRAEIAEKEDQLDFTEVSDMALKVAYIEVLKIIDKYRQEG